MKNAEILEIVRGDTEKRKVYWFSECCVQAGQSASDRAVEQFEKQGSDDVQVFEGTYREILDEAANYEAAAEHAHAGRDRFYRTIARTLYEFAGIDPDEKDEDEDDE